MLAIKVFVAYYTAPVPFSFCKLSSSVDKTRDPTCLKFCIIFSGKVTLNKKHMSI